MKYILKSFSKQGDDMSKTNIVFSKKQIRWVYFVLCFISFFIYYKAMKFLQGAFIDTTTLYLQSELFDCLILINAFLLIPIIIYSKKIISIAKKKLIFSLTSFCIIIFILPLFFIKTGIYADSKYVTETGLFGKEKAVYEYSDIKQVEITLKRGVQYDIVFSENYNLFLASDINLTKPFKNDGNLVKFDKLVSDNAITQEVFLPKTARWYESYLNTEEAKAYFLEKANQSR